MRNAFIQALVEEAGHNNKIMLLTGDLGRNIVEPFQKKFPDRFINVGVAEQNLISVSAGLAAQGFKPFAYSIATFVTMRPYEQIRNDVCLHQLPVTIVGVGGGLAYAKAGPTHHSIEDIALMRTLPITIISPADPVEMYQVTKQLTKLKTPAYLRIERNPMTNTFKKNDNFKIGKGYQITKGSEVAIMTTGTKCELAQQVKMELSKLSINPSLYSFSTIQPLDNKLMIKIINNYRLIVTIEEHRVSGGLGSVVSDAFFFKKNNWPTLLRFGLPDGHVRGSYSYQYLIEKGGLTLKYIIQSIIDNI